MNKLYQAVCKDVEKYCIEKGYIEGPGVNNFVPHDAVTAFGTAHRLVHEIGFDCYLAIAPEGHIYGYFFEKLGCKTMDVYVPYPADDSIQMTAKISEIKQKRILLIEDDVVSGKSLKVVVTELLRYEPAEILLILGHSRGVQHMENIPKEISRAFLADDIYNYCDYTSLENAFRKIFAFLEIHENVRLLEKE